MLKVEKRNYFVIIEFIAIMAINYEFTELLNQNSKWRSVYGSDTVNPTVNLLLGLG